MIKKITYKEYIIAFILIMIFVVSMAVVSLSQRTDKIEQRVGYLESDIKYVYD